MPRPRRPNASLSMSDSTASHSESEKECTGCGAQRPLSDFGKHISGAGGLRAKCKPCLNEESRDHYHKIADPEHIRGYGATLETVEVF